MYPTQGITQPRVGIDMAGGCHFMVKNPSTLVCKANAAKSPAHGAVGRCPAALCALFPGWGGFYIRFAVKGRFELIVLKNTVFESDRGNSSPYRATSFWWRGVRSN